MPDQLRYARLTGSEEPEVPGGGIPLPGAFHDVLYYMLNNGMAAPASALVKVIMDSVGEEVNGDRVQYVWGSWENLAADILGQLQERKLITPTGFGWWLLTDDFRPGVRTYILYYPDGRDLRIIVRSRKEHEIREKLSRAHARAQNYLVTLKDLDLYEGVVKETIDAHLQSLLWDENRPKLSSSKVLLPQGFTWDGDRTRGFMRRFSEAYLKAIYPNWATGGDVARAYNAIVPEGKPVTVTQPFERLNTLVIQGKAERQDDRNQPNQGGRPKVLFRWVPPGERNE